MDERSTELKRTAKANGKQHEPEAIRHDIERTRERLDSAVDKLSARLLATRSKLHPAVLWRERKSVILGVGAGVVLLGAVVVGTAALGGMIVRRLFGPRRIKLELRGPRIG